MLNVFNKKITLPFVLTTLLAVSQGSLADDGKVVETIKENKEAISDKDGIAPWIIVAGVILLTASQAE